MVLFKYGFIFLAGVGFGAAVAHRGCCDDRRRHGPCWRRHCGGGHRGGDGGLGRHHDREVDPAAASYENERRGYYFGRPGGDAVADIGAEEGEYRAVKKNSKKPAAAAAAATSDY